MAVRFMDGCDHYPFDANGILYKYDGRLSPMVIRESAGRFGGTNCLGTTGSFGGFVSKQLETSSSKYHVVAAAIQVDNFITSAASRIMWARPGNPSGSTYTTWTLTVEDNGVLRVRTGGSTVLDNVGTVRIQSPSGVFTSSVYHFVEVELFIDPVVGFVRLWVDGINVVEVVDVDNTSWFDDIDTPVDEIGLTQPSIWSCRFDDIHVLDDSGTVNTTRIGDARVHLLLPFEDGNTIQFTPDSGDNLTSVNETIADGGVSFVETGTIGNKDIYSLADTAIGEVFAVQPLALSTKTTSQSVTGSVIANNGLADFVAFSGPVPVDYKYMHGVFNTNPSTGLVWSATAINQLQWGYKLQDIG